MTWCFHARQALLQLREESSFSWLGSECEAEACRGSRQEQGALLECLFDQRLLRPETFAASLHRPS